MDTLSTNVRTYMVRQEIMSANALAKVAGIAPNTAKKLLDGKRSSRVMVSVVESAAHALNVDPWTLFRPEGQSGANNATDRFAQRVTLPSPPKENV